MAGSIAPLPVPERKCFQDHDSPRGKRWVAEYPCFGPGQTWGAERPDLPGPEEPSCLQPSLEPSSYLGVHAGWPVLSLNPTVEMGSDTQHSLLPLSIPPEDPCLSKSPTDLPRSLPVLKGSLVLAELKIIPGVKNVTCLGRSFHLFTQPF